LHVTFFTNDGRDVYTRLALLIHVPNSKTCNDPTLYTLSVPVIVEQLDLFG